MFRAKKRMGKLTLMVSLCAAIVFDMGSFIPLIGDIFILLATIIYALKRYAVNKKGEVLPLSSIIWVCVFALIEAIPVVSWIPSCTAFVIRFYVKNLRAVKTIERKEKVKKMSLKKLASTA